MAEITRLESGRLTVTVFLDDGKSLKIRKKDAALPCVQPGNEIDFDELTGRICASQLAEGYEAALSLLDYCARTEKTLRDKLRAKGYLEPVLDAVTERLRAARLLDDGMIAESIVSSMISSGKGLYAMKQKLRAKGISEEDSEAALAAVSDESQTEGCTETAKKLYRKYAALDRRQAKQKLSQALARRGFGWDSIETALSRIFDE